MSTDENTTTTSTPTASPVLSMAPTSSPTANSSMSTAAPSLSPSKSPTVTDTVHPSHSPSRSPTRMTSMPSHSPTIINVTYSPTLATSSPVAIVDATNSDAILIGVFAIQLFLLAFVCVYLCFCRKPRIRKEEERSLVRHSSDSRWDEKLKARQVAITRALSGPRSAWLDPELDQRHIDEETEMTIQPGPRYNTSVVESESHIFGINPSQKRI